MRTFLLQIFVGQGVEAREHIFAACFILFFYVIPELFSDCFLFAALQEGAKRVEGFLV